MIQEMTAGRMRGDQGSDTTRRAGSSATIGVNLSGISIGDPDVLALVGRELDRSGVDPSRLLFEVTETAAVLNMARAGRFAAE